MATKKQTKKKSEEDLLDQATLQLLKAVKVKAAKDGKPIRKADLVEQGYSKRFIAKVEAA